MTQNLLVYFFIFIFGISLGSFFNVLVYRLINNISLISPPSTCPSCNTKLKWFYNIPIISWLILHGKCAYCKNKIGVKYLFYELFFGIFAMGIYYFSSNFMDISFLQKIFLFFIFYFLFAMSVIDFKTHLVYDILSIPTLFLSLFPLINSFEDLIHTSFKVILVGLFFYLFIIKLYSKIRNIQVLGEGDILILMILVALLDINGFIVSIFISSIIGFIFYFFSKDKEIPFVPTLSLSLLITFFIKYYFNLDNLYFTFLIN